MNFYNSLDVIIYLKKNKYFILSGGFCAIVVFLAIKYFSPRIYESNVIVYNANKFNNETATGKTSQQIQDIDDAYTIINWVYSTELINHLLSKFNLLQHYQIDTSKESHYTLGFNLLSDNISVSTTSYNAVKISVRDKDRIKSAEIANEIIRKVDALNEGLVIANRKQIIQVYDVLLEELSEECNRQKDNISSLTDKLSAVIARSKVAGISTFKMEGLENSLLKAGFNFEKSSSDWLNTKKSHLMSLKYIEKFNLPSFVIVRHALPPASESPYTFANLGLLILLFILGSWIIIFFLIMKYRYGEYLGFLLKTEEEINIYREKLMKGGKIRHLGNIKLQEKPYAVPFGEKETAS